jgi:hypothetical protein
VQPQHLARVLKLISQGLVHQLRRAFFGSEGSGSFARSVAAACGGDCDPASATYEALGLVKALLQSFFGCEVGAC